MKAQQRLAESALRDSEERIRGILRTGVEGIMTIDERGIVDSTNPAAEKLFGWRADEVIGKNVNVLMAAPYRAEHDGYLANCLRTGKGNWRSKNNGAGFRRREKRAVAWGCAS